MAIRWTEVDEFTVHGQRSGMAQKFETLETEMTTSRPGSTVSAVGAGVDAASW